MNRYDKDVNIRKILDNETIVKNNENSPLVISSKSNNSLEFLRNFLTNHSSSIEQDLVNYGAVLFRGFNIKNEIEFESAVKSLPILEPFSDVFMAEPGRQLVEGTEFVWYTNKFFKTGGSFYLGGFHTENYYTPSVPSYICFFCMRPSTFGGETGLVNMQKVYKKLDLKLKNKLIRRQLLANFWLIDEVADYYNISFNEAKELIKTKGLELINIAGNELAMLSKPSIVHHLKTNKQTLQINISRSLLSIDKYLQRYFILDYSGLKWILHRFSWQFPKAFYKIKNCVFKSKSLHSSKFSSVKRQIKIDIKKSKVSLEDIFLEQDIDSLAKIIRENFFSFYWQKGDILLVDNMKMAHAGMPGIGRRIIRSILCNSINLHNRE